MPCRAGWWWLLGEATTWPIHRTRNFPSPGGSEQRLWISPFSVLVNWKQRGGKGLFRIWDYVLYRLSPCHPNYIKNKFRIQEQQLDDFQVMSMVPLFSQTQVWLIKLCLDCDISLLQLPRHWDTHTALVFETRGLQARHDVMTITNLRLSSCGICS